MITRPPAIIALSDVYDDNYHQARGEEIPGYLSRAKRRDLFRCLESASGREVIVLSPPPKPLKRRSPKWLPAVTTRFSTHLQLFCCNWDIPKLRVPLSWFFYAFHVVKNTRSGDLIVVDNYILINILAAWAARLFHRVTFILDYEDGRHLIDRGLDGVFSAVAETIGRPLMSGAFLAHPGLGERLPPGTPTLLIPGFVASKPQAKKNAPGAVRFLYSGSLDHVRGLDLILKALPLLPETGWTLDITGNGPLGGLLREFLKNPRWEGRVAWHQTLPGAEYGRLLGSCMAGLNCQRSADPVSNVTFPSKIFTYLSEGMLILSSKAGMVKEICGDACIYYEEETPASLAAAMQYVIGHYEQLSTALKPEKLAQYYSLDETALRIKNRFFGGKS